MDFDHPQGEVWPGFLNEHYVKCSDCDGYGYSASGKAFEQILKLLTLAGHESTYRPHGYKQATRRHCGEDRPVAEPRNYNGSLYPHPYVTDAGIVDPGTALHEVVSGLGGSPHESLGGNCWGMMKTVLAAAGLPEEWCNCHQCKGSGTHPDHAEAHDAWEETPVPTGEGWQMWETTSEGSPISPVFATAEELARWLADTGASALGGDGATYEQWMGTCVRGWAPSMMSTPETGLTSGVAALGEKQ